MDKYMGKENLFIRMDQNMKVILLKVEKKEQGNLLFQIKTIITDIGLVGNRMELGHFSIKIINS